MKTDTLVGLVVLCLLMSVVNWVVFFSNPSIVRAVLAVSITVSAVLNSLTLKSIVKFRRLEKLLRPK